MAADAACPGRRCPGTARSALRRGYPSGIAPAPRGIGSSHPSAADRRRKEGKRIGGAPILPAQLQQRQVRKGVDGGFKHAEGFATGAKGDGKGKPLIAAGGFTGEGGVRKGPAQRAVGGLVMFVAHKYAVMMCSVLVKLPVLDAVVDDLCINAHGSADR